ncbi:MAG: NAD-dependent epimerase/dehydratase family protein, partial [Nocardioides sp.]
MRILVTGATGNVGTALVRHLTGPHGSKHRVVAVARRPPVVQGDGLRGIEWHDIDLTDPADAPRLVEAMAGADAVVHLAWGFQPSHDLEYLERLAVGGTRLVAESAVAVGVPRLVHMSSVGAYSAKQSDDPVDESWPTHGIA